MLQVADVRDVGGRVDALLGHEAQGLREVPGPAARRARHVELAVVDEARIERDVLPTEWQAREEVEHAIPGHEVLG